MSTTLIAERGTMEYTLIDKAVSQQAFTAEVKRIDSSSLELRGAIDKLEKKVDKGFSDVNAHFDKLEKSVDARFDKLEKSVDVRFDKVDTKIDGVRQDVQSGFRWLITTQIAFTLLILGVIYNVFMK